MVMEETCDEEAITSIFKDRGFEISRLGYEIEFPKKEKTCVFTVSARDDISINDVVQSLSELGSVKKLEIKN